MINWLSIWDKLYEELEKKNSWGKNEIKELMDKLEKDSVRKSEAEAS
jgi:hypothetical protein